MKAVPALVAFGFLSACSSVPTDLYYGPLGGEDGVYAGYSQMMRGTNTCSVRYTGDQYMSGTTVRDLTLLRSAEITRKIGFHWFVITEQVNESGHITEGTSFNGVTNVQVNSSWSGGVDNLTGSQTVDTRFISQYRYEIKCYPTDPSDPEALDATVVETEIRAIYGLSESVDEPILGTGST